MKPLSATDYLTHAIAAQRYRWTRSSAQSSDLSRTVDALAASDSTRLGHFLCKQRSYRRVKRAIARRNRAHLRRSAAFVAESLRAVGVAVPHERVIDGLGISQVTWALSQYLSLELGWQRVDAMVELSVGDIVFTADSHCCPGIPHHVMVFMGWHDAARGQALVVDHRGFLVVRDLRATVARPVHSDRPSTTGEAPIDARFGYALRARSGAPAHLLAASAQPAQQAERLAA